MVKLTDITCRMTGNFSNLATGRNSEQLYRKFARLLQQTTRK